MASRANEQDAPKDHNYTLLQGYNWHSSGDSTHWPYLESQVTALADMGITALWIPPPTKAASQASVGFDTYDLWDLGEFDQKGGKPTKWGDKAQLLALCKAAKAAGLVIYIDAVLNHKSGADETEVVKVREVDQEDRTKYISDEFEIEAWTKFEYAPRNNAHSDFKWSWVHFTGTDFDNKTGKNGIFKIMGKNKDWGNADDAEKGNFDYLLGQDIDLKHGDVVKDLENWGEWIIRELGASGFRFDAVRHMDEEFMQNFIKNVRKRTGKELFGVGEFFTESLESLVGYLDRFGAQFSLFDTILHYNFQEAGTQTENYDMRKIFDGTLVQARPTDAVTFVDNHDTQPGQTLDSWVNPQFKPLAYALILLRHEGYPAVFAGDLWGITEGDKAEPVSQLADFVKARKLFSYGETRDYFDHANCIGWVRSGDKVHDGCAVVLCNGSSDGKKFMEVGSDHAGEKWVDLLGWFQGEVEIGKEGWAEFSCHAMSVAIWTKVDAKGKDQFKK